MKNLIIKTTIVTFSIGYLAGCAGPTGANYRPIADTKGVDLNRYEADLRDCQAYATQTAGAGESAATGAVVGAVFGAILGAAAGVKNNNRTATVGAVTGAASAGVEGEKNQRSIIRNCMGGRGYKVLQ